MTTPTDHHCDVVAHVNPGGYAALRCDRHTPAHPGWHHDPDRRLLWRLDPIVGLITCDVVL
jgi:hypothetical protein